MRSVSNKLERLECQLLIDRLNFDQVFADIVETMRRLGTGRTETSKPLLQQLKKHVENLEADDPILDQRWELLFDEKRRTWFLNTSPAWRSLERLVRYANRGELDKIRTCPICQRWFFARREDHVCCSSRCRQKLHASTPEFREERRQYMKKLRRLHKHMDLRALRAARQGLRQKANRRQDAKRSDRKN